MGVGDRAGHGSVSDGQPTIRHNLLERGDAGYNVPGWDRGFVLAEKLIPNGDPVIQAIGAKGTASQHAHPRDRCRAVRPARRLRRVGAHAGVERR